MSRRRFLQLLGLGGGAVVVVGAGGITWRAMDQGVFAAGSGPAYAAWDALGSPAGTPLDLVRAAVLAASAHNTQPWIFEVSDRRIDLFVDPARNLGTIDPLRREQYISLGCALENLALAGPSAGWHVDLSVLPDPHGPQHVARAELVPLEEVRDPLADAIPDRNTNRAAFDSARGVDRATLDALAGVIADTGTEVIWTTDPEGRSAFGELVVAATRAIIDDKQQAADDYAWYRSSWSDIQERKDGVTSDAAGLSPFIGLLAKILPASQAQNDDAWLSATRDTHVATAAAFGTLAVGNADDVGELLAAGRAWQRMALWAEANGLATQPLNQVEERADRERTTGADPTFATALAEFVPAGRQAVFSFRLGYPTQAAARSPRRPAEDVIRTPTPD